jgi:hypothetical protein
MIIFPIVIDISPSYLYFKIVRIKAVITIKIYSVVRIEMLYLHSSASKFVFDLYDFPFARQKTLQYAEAENRNNKSNFFITLKGQ